MEIKDVTSVVPLEGTTVSEHTGDEARQDRAKDSAGTQDVVTVSANVKTVEINDSRLKANGAISAVNVFAENVEKIGAVFKSLEGLVEQAADRPADAASKLEDEGQRLIDEVDSLIRKISSHASGETAAPGAVQAEVERSVGKALHLIVLNKAKAFGLDKLELTNKEALLITQNNVAKARAQFEQFKSTVSKAALTARAASVTADVAAVRRDHSRNPIRQAEEAVRVTGTTKGAISADPATAINSIGDTNGLEATL